MLATIITLVSSILFSQSLFFSEYAEGTSNNKYLEIYNPTSESIDLSGYAFPSTANEPSTPGMHEYWNEFDSGSIIAPGDVFVICHGSSDALILAECDQFHTYLSNGNDGYCLVSGPESSYDILDCVGDFNADPGNGWDVAGVSEATKDHTLVRKESVTSGNLGDWTTSAGTDANNSEWEVYDVNTWDYLGSHNSGGSGDTGGGDDGTPVADAGQNQIVDFSASVTLDGSASYDSDGIILGYSWSQVSGPNVNVDNYEQAVISFDAPSDYCVLEFSLQVFDDEFNYSTIDYVTVTVGTVSIYDFQYTEEQGQYCFESDMDGQEVTVSGIVTHVKSGSYPNFFLQDPECDDLWCGVYVYDTSVDTQVGDIISVTAEIEEYYSMTELVNVSSYSVISSDNDVSSTLITAEDLGIECSLSGEQYESMLVEIRNVSFDSVDEFGNWTVSDNTGMVMVDDYHFDGTFPSISAGDSFDCVTGVVAYSYGEFKIYPRNTDDFSCSGCLSNGDVNSDTNVDVLDIVSIVAYVLGNSEFDSNELCISDVNQDTNVDVLDIVSIVSSILGNR